MCFVYGEITLEQDTQSYLPEAEKHPTVTASSFNKSTVQILQCFPTGSTNTCMFSSNFDTQYYIHKVL